MSIGKHLEMLKWLELLSIAGFELCLIADSGRTQDRWWTAENGRIADLGRHRLEQIKSRVDPVFVDCNCFEMTLGESLFSIFLQPCLYLRFYPQCLTFALMAR